MRRLRTDPSEAPSILTANKSAECILSALLIPNWKFMPINDRDQTLRLSFAQQRLWLLTQMDGVSEAYHMPIDLRFVRRTERSSTA